MGAMSVRVDPETKERVVRLQEERGVEAPEQARSASHRRAHERAGIPVDAMRASVDRARIDAGQKPG